MNQPTSRSGLLMDRAFGEKWAGGERWWKLMPDGWYHTADHKGPYLGAHPTAPDAIMDQASRYYRHLAEMALADAEARAREACTFEKRTTCSFVASEIEPSSARWERLDRKIAIAMLRDNLANRVNTADAIVVLRDCGHVAEAFKLVNVPELPQ